MKCPGCPPNPAEPKNGDERDTRIIEDAVIERKFPGLVLELKADEGVIGKNLRKSMKKKVERLEEIVMP